jgi:hypothetical protein
MDDSEIFEPSEAISLLGEHTERFGSGERLFFFLFRTCMTLPAHLGPYEIRAVAKGCAVTMYGKRAEYEIRMIEANDDRSIVAVLMQPFSDKTGRARQRVFEGWADESGESFLSVLRAITRCEGLTLFMFGFAAQLREGWAEYLRVRDDRLGF